MFAHLVSYVSHLIEMTSVKLCCAVFWVTFSLADFENFGAGGAVGVGGWEHVLEGVGTLSRFSEGFLPTVDDTVDDSALAYNLTVEVDASAGLLSFSASCHLLKTANSSSSLPSKLKQSVQIRPDLETFSDSGSPNSVSHSLMLLSVGTFFWKMDRIFESVPFKRKFSLHSR